MNEDTNCSEAFIGLDNFDNGWKWTDGTIFEYNQWNEGLLI
jgi:hypothetical protein